MKPGTRIVIAAASAGVVVASIVAAFVFRTPPVGGVVAIYAVCFVFSALATRQVYRLVMEEW